MPGLRIAIAAAVATLALSGAAKAQTYPNAQVRLIVPTSPGGVTDTMARIVAQRLTEQLGQTVIVDNRAGGNGSVGAIAVAHAPTDGLTLLVTSDATITANPSLSSKLGYSAKDFTPIVVLCRGTPVLVVNGAVPANNVKELIALAKAKPGALNYGTYGVGSTGHLNMELFESMTGTKMTPVHYKGAQPAMLDVIAGNIPMMLISVGNAVAQAKDNRVKFIADGAPERMKLLPDVPTIAETVPGYTAASWFGLYGPAGIPDEVVTKINEEIRKTFNDPQVINDVLNPQYFVSIAGTPQELAAKINAEEPRFHKVISDAHIMAQ